MLALTLALILALSLTLALALALSPTLARSRVVGATAGREATARLRCGAPSPNPNPNSNPNPHSKPPSPNPNPNPNPKVRLRSEAFAAPRLAYSPDDPRALAALRKVQAGELGRRLGRRPHPGTHVPIDGLPEGFARRACASLVAHAPHASMDAASASLWWAGA